MSSLTITTFDEVIENDYRTRTFGFGACLIQTQDDDQQRTGHAEIL